MEAVCVGFFFSSRRRHTRCGRDWSSDVCSSDLGRVERLSGVWTVVYNKYYVDELYAATVLAPAVWVARAFSRFDGTVLDGLVNFAGAVGRFLGRFDAAIDRYLVDGAVNAFAAGTLGFGRSLRGIQTGRIQTYLYGALEI